jgi:hypothetical protein
MDLEIGIGCIGAGILVAFGGWYTLDSYEKGKPKPSHLYFFHGKLGIIVGAVIFLLGIINCIFSIK